MYAYAGKILRINLTNGQMRTEKIEKYSNRFIGGRGVNQWILLNEVAPTVHAFDPENPILFGVGPLVGTFAPGACRVSIDSKSAFGGGVGSANFGGHFGAELKFAGFDHLIIFGKAKRPIYLWISDGEAELRDASAIWGKTTWETEDIIRSDMGDEGIRVAVIGPAGENLVRPSCIVADRAKIGGGSGIAAIMGSKNLKAVAVRGTNSIEVADPEGFQDAAFEAFKKVSTSPNASSIRSDTINALCHPDSKIWFGMPVRNGQDDFWEMDKRKKVSSEAMKRFRRRIFACSSCPIGCMPFFDIREGAFAPTKGEGFWINSIMSYGTRFDIDDPEALVHCHLLANQLGLDGDNASVAISWAFECYERGLLTRHDTEGLELSWGNSEALVKMMWKLAHRDGIGDLLADGVKAASERLGKGSGSFAIHIKGQDSLDGIRVRKGWALGIVTAPCAGRHLRGAIGPGQFDIDHIAYEGQARHVFWQEQYKAIQDMVGVCVYTGLWSGTYALGPEDYAKLLSRATGIERSAADLMLVGRQIHNIEKAFNTLHKGYTQQDDFPPERYLNESVKSGPYSGERLQKEQWEKMLNDYYAIQEWDQETSWQTEACLKKLDLADVAVKLRKAGRLRT